MTVGRMIQEEHKCEKLSISRVGRHKAKSLTENKRVPVIKGLTSNLPKRATLHVVINVVSSLATPKETAVNYSLMHTGTGSPPSYISLEKAHADKRLAISENRGQGIIPITRKSEMVGNVSFKGLEDFRSELVLDILGALRPRKDINKPSLRPVGAAPSGGQGNL